jgi:hypothetical protein
MRYLIRTALYHPAVPHCRWAYTGYLPYGNLTKRFMEDERRKAGDNSSEPASLPHPERDYNPFEADAMEVCMSGGGGGGGAAGMARQCLYSRVKVLWAGLWVSSGT